MSFSSLPFLFVFFPIFFILYYLLPARVKTAWLLLGSLIFYYWGCREAPWQLGLMCLMVLVNFCLGHVIGRSSHPKPWLVVGLLFNFCRLCGLNTLPSSETRCSPSSPCPPCWRRNPFPWD